MSGVRIVLLCEDKQTDSFVRRFLQQRNIRGRDVTTAPLPDGSQSGEQWVRERYPKELKAVRQRQDTFLIVVIDGDNNPTERRHEQVQDHVGRLNRIGAARGRGHAVATQGPRRGTARSSRG